MIFYQNEFCTIEIDEVKSIALVTWTAESKNMTVEQFKEEQLAQLEAAKKYQLKYFILNGKLMQFPITPDLQDWIVENAIKPSIEVGVKKSATILPKEIFSQVSVEQTMNDGADDSIAQYFDNIEDAKKWLLS